MIMNGIGNLQRPWMLINMIMQSLKDIPYINLQYPRKSKH